MNTLAKAMRAFVRSGGDRTRMNVPHWSATYNCGVEDVRGLRFPFASHAWQPNEPTRLVQMLHGAIAFPHTRSHIFDMDVHGRLPELVAMMVRVWLPGAIAEVRRLTRP